MVQAAAVKFNEGELQELRWYFERSTARPIYFGQDVGEDGNLYRVVDDNTEEFVELHGATRRTRSRFSKMVISRSWRGVGRERTQCPSSPDGASA